MSSTRAVYLCFPRGSLLDAKPCAEHASAREVDAVSNLRHHRNLRHQRNRRHGDTGDSSITNPGTSTNTSSRISVSASTSISTSTSFSISNCASVSSSTSSGASSVTNSVAGSSARSSARSGVIPGNSPIFTAIDRVGVNDVVDINIRRDVSGPQVFISVTIARLAIDLVLRDDLVSVLGPLRAVAAFFVAVMRIQAALL